MVLSLGVDFTETIYFDCYDQRYYEAEISVSAGHKIFNFIFDPGLKADKKFSFGLFVDELAMSSRVCYRYPRGRRICLLKESPLYTHSSDVKCLERRYDCVFTFDHELTSMGNPYKPLYYGTSWINDGVPSENVEKTKLVSFVGSIEHEQRAGYILRRAIAQELIKDGRVDCFGKGIQWIDSKEDGVKSYRFSIAMENIQKDYYFSEKLIDCFLSDTVPIYWGCQGIGEIFDLRGILSFNDLTELLVLLDCLTEEKYLEMLPYVKKNKQIALDMKLNNTKGLYARLAEGLSELADHGSALSRFSRSKIMAGVRSFYESCRN